MKLWILLICSLLPIALFAQKGEEQRELLKRIQQAGFKVEINHASTSTMPNTHRFNPQGSLSYETDFTQASLPYFGRSRNAGYGSGDSGIQFEGKPQDQEWFLPKRGGVQLTYEVKGEHERFDVQVSLFGSGHCQFLIQSDYREVITYQGYYELINLDTTRLKPTTEHNVKK